MAQRTEIGIILKKIVFEGRVASGEGSGKIYLSLPWVRQQIEGALGSSPYLGTLNLNLTKQSISKKMHLEKEKATVIYPAKGYSKGLLFKAQISGFKCALILPQVNGYPENLLEVVAALNLREALKLKNDDLVVVVAET